MLRPGTNLAKSSVTAPRRREVALGLADAGGGFEGEAAEELEDAVAVATAEGEPDGVGDEAGEQASRG